MDEKEKSDDLEMRSLKTPEVTPNRAYLQKIYLRQNGPKRESSLQAYVPSPDSNFPDISYDNIIDAIAQKPVKTNQARFTSPKLNYD